LKRAGRSKLNNLSAPRDCKEGAGELSQFRKTSRQRGTDKKKKMMHDGPWGGPSVAHQNLARHKKAFENKKRKQGQRRDSLKNRSQEGARTAAHKAKRDRKKNKRKKVWSERFKGGKEGGSKPIRKRGDDSRDQEPRQTSTKERQSTDPPSTSDRKKNRGDVWRGGKQ